MLSLQRRIHRADSGFGLIEVIVALVIAGIVFSALAPVLVASVQASLFGRQNQQATDFMTREVEQLRSLNFGALTNLTTDAASDSRLTACGAARCLQVDGTPEPVVTATAGALPIAKVLNGAETNKTAFTVSRYVTQIADQPVGQAKRATVYISWRNKGVLKTRSVSTIIAYAQSGLPLPVFKLVLPIPSVTINPDAQVTFVLSLTNQGAPDRWNLTRTGSLTGWTWYADSNANGALDLTTDDLLSDTTSDAITDTGRIDPSTTFRFFLTRYTPASEPVGTTSTTITATSFGQPTAFGAAKNVVASTVVVLGAIPPGPGPTPTATPTTPATPPAQADCPAPAPALTATTSNGFSLQPYVPHTVAGDTPQETQMYFGATSGSLTSLGHFSTNIDSAATGRILVPSLGTEPTPAQVTALTDPSGFADWSKQFGGKSDIAGSGVLRLWAARYGAGTGPVTVKVVLYTADSKTLSKTIVTSAQVSLGTLSCAGFQEFYVKLPDVASVAIGNNDWLGVRVVTWGTDKIRLAYDVPSSYPALFTMGTK